MHYINLSSVLGTLFQVVADDDIYGHSNLLTPSSSFLNDHPSVCINDANLTIKDCMNNSITNTQTPNKAHFATQSPSLKGMTENGFAIKISDKKETREFSTPKPNAGFTKKTSSQSDDISESLSLHSEKSAKKRLRNSDEMNFNFDNEKETPHKPSGENSTWKSQFKKLKLKESFKFKSKDKPIISRKQIKKINILSDKDDDSGEENRITTSSLYTSTPSPYKDDDNLSICSIASTAKMDRSFFSSSGIFDISISSMRSTKSSKPMTRLRRGVKSLTASFRGERKKKIEKKRKESDSESDDDNRKLNFSTSKGTPMCTPSKQFNLNFEISPLKNEDKTPLTRISEQTESENFVTSPVIFKTPKNVVRQTNKSSIYENVTPKSNTIISKNLKRSSAAVDKRVEKLSNRTLPLVLTLS